MTNQEKFIEEFKFLSMLTAHHISTNEAGILTAGLSWLHEIPEEHFPKNPHVRPVEVGNLLDHLIDARKAVSEFHLFATHFENLAP